MNALAFWVFGGLVLELELPLPVEPPLPVELPLPVVFPVVFVIIRGQSLTHKYQNYKTLGEQTTALSLRARRYNVQTQ